MPAHVGAGVPANINVHRGLSPRGYDFTEAERVRYDTYGQRTTLAPDGITTRTASSYNQQIGFTGRYEDKETKLCYFRARYYSGTLGRFIERDPAGYKDGYGLYNSYFVPNALDPEGLFTFEAGASFGQVTILAGPLAPGVGWALTVEASGSIYECDCKCWAKTELTIGFSLIGGGAFNGLKPVTNPRGSKYRDVKTGRFAKGPKAGDKAGPSAAGVGAEIGEDCSTGLSGSVEFKVAAQAGIVLAGIACDASCSYSPTNGWDCSAKCIGGIGIAGAQLSATVSGKLTLVGPCGKPFELLDGLAFKQPPQPNTLGYGNHYGVGYGGGGIGL
jgi:RHS repeat-associated protein